MKIKAAIIERNSEGNILSQAAIATQAVVDLKDKTAVFLDSDAIEIESISWDRNKQRFVVGISLGTYDGDGNYQRNPEYPIAETVWGAKIAPAIWEKYGLSDVSALNLSDVKQWLFNEHSIYFRGRDNWSIQNFEAKLTDDAGKLVKDFSK